MGAIGAVRAFAPGRVNLIGDHTDYTGGLVLPMALQMGTTVTGRRGGPVVRLSTDAFEHAEAEFDVPVVPPLRLEGWGRYAEAVAAVLLPAEGFTGRVSSDLPIGAGLSSSASLEVALALAFGGAGGLAGDTARACQQAEELASGVPCGIMDQLVSLAGVEGHALLIDCSSLSVDPVPIPEEAEIVVIHSGQPRRLAGSAYAERRRACEQAASRIGPLRSATLADLAGLDSPLLRARARHVISENSRVNAFAAALRSGDLQACGQLMVASHRSLAEDFEVSTDRLDAMVSDLAARPGVYGARLTGAGFGGCVVALADPGVLRAGWTVRPSGGAYVEWLP